MPYNWPGDKHFSGRGDTFSILAVFSAHFLC